MFARAGLFAVCSGCVCLLSGTVWGQDFLLRYQVDTYEKVTVGDDVQETNESRRLEAYVTFDVPFQQETVHGRNIMSVEGVVTKSKEGKLEVELKYSDQFDTGAYRLKENGEREKVFTGSKGGGVLTLRLGEAIVHASSGTTSLTTESDGVEVIRREESEHIVEFVPAVRS